MNMNLLTAKVIQTETLVGIGIMAVGLLLSGTDLGHDVLLAGTAVLVFSPLTGVIASTYCLWKEGDRPWLRIALVLIAAIAVGLIFTALR